MEWSYMELEHVRYQIKTGKAYIACRDHKTKRTMGTAGKWIPPAAWMAVKEFLKLPYRLEGKPYALLFEVPHVTVEWCEAATVPVCYFKNAGRHEPAIHSLQYLRHPSPNRRGQRQAVQVQRPDLRFLDCRQRLAVIVHHVPWGRQR